MQRSTRPIGRVQCDNQGRVLLITGGAQGIGWAIADAFYRSGACVVCMDVVPAEQPNDARCEYFQGDTSQEELCQAAVEKAVERFGGLGTLGAHADPNPKV